MRDEMSMVLVRGGSAACMAVRGRDILAAWRRIEHRSNEPLELARVSKNSLPEIRRFSFRIPSIRHRLKCGGIAAAAVPSGAPGRRPVLDRAPMQGGLSAHSFSDGMKIAWMETPFAARLVFDLSHRVPRSGDALWARTCSVMARPFWRWASTASIRPSSRTATM